MELSRYSIIKLTSIVVLVLFVGVLALGVRPVGTTFATGQGQGGLELLIDSTTYYNGALQPALSWDLKDLVPGVDHFFYFTDVKPGDTGISTISVHLRKNPAWVCLDFLNLVDEENGTSEPEALVDSTEGGDLSSELEFFAWLDDGDNTFEVGEEPLFGTSSQAAAVVLGGQTYAITDRNNGPAQRPNQTKYVGIAWCAGDLSVDLDTAEITCDPLAMGNEAQTDSMSLDISLRAVPAGLFPGYSCTEPGGPLGGPGRGNNGHGNDDDHNDDSNPGHSNDEDDDTDDDGLPPGFVKDDNHHNDDYTMEWHKPTKEEKKQSWLAGWSFFKKFN
ncbi:MAG: hypothetical protein KC877_02930 [Candidatus Kaiserbacteria bacterium]|nr:hypothetical protein [Candidatus Kaiserbacteria bacterium]MCB9816884.1 hypothetical protein [Candidatus Nomurabacteria bacterium]